MKLFKAGIVGCGNIGALYDEKDLDSNVYTHAGMYRQTNEFELVAAADSDKKRLEAFGNYWKVNHLYESHEEMFQNEKLDIISIATPDETHEKVILDAVKYSLPRIIFTEKPLSMNLESAKKVYVECKKKNIALVVDYVRRWDTNHKNIKKFIKEGKLGPIQSITGYYVRGLRHNGCQIINLIRFIFGEISSVQVSGASNMGSLEGDPSINFSLFLKNGIEAQIIALDKNGYGYSIFELDIFGINGRIRLLEGGQKIEYYKVNVDQQFPNFRKLNKLESFWKELTYGTAMIHAGNQFVSYLSGQSMCLSNMALDAINDLKVIEAVIDSSKHNNYQANVNESGCE